ncbi:molybdate ABC transporter substrate-binding protein [Methylophilus medardicus]|uniref:Molybdate-binding protein ModA n=1 Tax=Methylophilus medardicus TaxID=2588534 RepID=A0A5B8CTV7_9PROT|nr:molybdate ABC transporter substrate-binding protein [Methylophilus medardicus]QDC44731.1 molybdate ABC transporter substrate-binding protein [Methylophilus medardicus]QDC49738.1 molybdate ABC transporter substrate-binding protein [Methylophilus medardicus]QDC53443.1 molybdate ABC transporter substrate-binding protein [Methylophilus medardicus]
MEKWIWLGLSLISLCAQADEKKVRIFAAASLTDVMNVLIKQYSKQTGEPLVPVYGGSGTLAKQLEQGAPGDLFISADEKWMQYLKDKQLVQVASIKPWLSNRLVMVTPLAKPLSIRAEPSTDIRQQAPGYWCTGDTLSVPVGIYAKQSLMALGWWETLKGRLVSTQDVRATLRLVERDECDVGIVYASDAQSSSQVKVAGEFPENSHVPIVYPMALLPQAGAQANGFYRYLQSAEAKKWLISFGFKPVFADSLGE